LALAIAWGAAGTAVAEPLPFACQPPFSGDMSAESLTSAFGEENVQTGSVIGVDGEPFEATIVYPEISRKRIVVAWLDEAAHARPESISVLGESDWIGPQGIRFGMELAEIERLNGERFRIYGFGVDHGGLASFERGRLAALPGGCRLEMAFDPTPGLPFTGVIGEVRFWSDDPEMLAARPRLYQMKLRFPGGPDG
jgi:hypothetical protein